MYPLNIISETVDTLVCDLSGAVELPSPPHVPLTDYFVNGGPILMSIITILLIAVLFAAWKAPAWVRELGILALASSLFMTCMGFYQIFNTIMLYGEASFRVYCQGLTIALLPFLLYSFNHHSYCSETENIDEQNNYSHSCMHGYDILLPRFCNSSLGAISVCF